MALRGTYRNLSCQTLSPRNIRWAKMLGVEEKYDKTSLHVLHEVKDPPVWRGHPFACKILFSEAVAESRMGLSAAMSQARCCWIHPEPCWICRQYVWLASLMYQYLLVMCC
ncbi:hypothetical protein HHUSO_G6632 [Huso huso]|uniref:Uncharacterized protein n=1 Tax=Huso huso TaxID=61971 RepID=A0ABR0ZY36_HUSHU